MKGRSRIEQLWAHEKYTVMYHSQNHYDRIRAALRDEPSYGTVADLIEAAKAVPPTSGSMVNACDHMWGYFKKVSDAGEKAQYEKLKLAFLEGEAEARNLTAFIHRLAGKYEVDYLLKSTLLQPEG